VIYAATDNFFLTVLLI